MNQENVFKAIDDNFDDHVESLISLVSIPNLITSNEEIQKVLDIYSTRIASLGGTVEIIDLGNMPLIYGKIDSGSEKTLIVYKNYDIVDPETMDWKRDPFSGAVLRIDEEMAIMGRGSCEPKGPMVGFLNALKEIKRVEGKLPVNIIFVIEGDEQVGSPTLQEFVKIKKEEFQKADAVLVPGFSQTSQFSASVPLGVKGVVIMELICRGGAWGGPIKFSLHSSNSAWVASPAWRLVRALSTLINKNEEILVDGFYDDISASESLMEHNVTKRQQSQIEFMKGNHVLKFKYDMTNEELFKKYLFTPTLNISSLITQGLTRWSKMVLPHEARARIDIRLVPEMDPDKTVAQIRRHLHRNGFGDIEILTHVSYPYWKGRTDYKPVRDMIDVYRAFKVKPEILPNSGTSLPLYVFQRELDLPLVIGGMGQGGKAYHTNEYVYLDGFKSFEKSMVSFLAKMCEEETS